MILDVSGRGEYEWYLYKVQAQNYIPYGDGERRSCQLRVGMIKEAYMLMYLGIEPGVQERFFALTAIMVKLDKD